MRFPWVRAPSPPPWVEPSYWAFNLTFSVLFLIYMTIGFFLMLQEFIIPKHHALSKIHHSISVPTSCKSDSQISPLLFRQR